MTAVPTGVNADGRAVEWIAPRACLGVVLRASALRSSVMAVVAAPPAPVAAPPAPSTLTVQFLVPDITTGAVASRPARTAAARSPSFEVVFNERAPSLRGALPQLGWCDVAATGSGTTLHALVIAIGPLLSPLAPLPLADGHLGVLP